MVTNDIACHFMLRHHNKPYVAIKNVIELIKDFYFIFPKANTICPEYNKTVRDDLLQKCRRIVPSFLILKQFDFRIYSV